MSFDRKYLLSVNMNEIPGRAVVTFVHFSREYLTEEQFKARTFPLLASDAPELDLMRLIVNGADGKGTMIRSE